MATTMSFFDKLDKLPVYNRPGPGASNKDRDPLVVMKEKFATNADAQIKLLEDPKQTEGRWFKKVSEKEVALYFRNINTIMELGGKVKSERRTVGSVKEAIQLLKEAKIAAAAGLLDDEFKRTARKPNTKRK